MKTFFNKDIFIIALSVFFLAGCSKPRDFFPDANNPGLSRFTSRGYDIVSAYIDDTAYANPTVPFSLFTFGNSPVLIYMIHTNTAFDTLHISWNIAYSDTTIKNAAPYDSLFLLIPVSKPFTENDFLALQGKRFTEDSTTNISIRLNSYFNTVTPTGPAGVYFVKIDSVPGNTVPAEYSFSGLFEGNIGNNIQITKGRFDFYIDPSQINF